MKLLLIIKETVKPGSQTFKITPATPDIYHLLLNNEELNHYKMYNIHPEIIKAIENLKPLLRDIQLDKLI